MKIESPSAFATADYPENRAKRHASSGVLAIAAALLLALPAYGETPEEMLASSPNIQEATWPGFKEQYPTSALCTPAEITLWTCETKKKTYSLCSSHEVTEHTGYIQYRAGHRGHAAFRFPETQQPPTGLFKLNMIANGNATMTFNNGGYAYTLFDDLRGPSAILVDKRGNASNETQIACLNPNQSLMLNYTIKLGILSGIFNPD